jgi:hypothetical protein
MDTDKKQHSDLGNDEDLKNAEGNNVTGVKTSDLRRDNDKPVTPGNQTPAKHDSQHQDPRNQEPTKHPANEDPTKHDPMHDSTKNDPKHDKSKTATGSSKQ